VLLAVALVNAMNFVDGLDGLDGLAAGIVGIAAVAFFAYSYSISRNSADTVFSLASLISAALIGCCLGFLPHNFNPARIFMGDSGSMLLGLLMSAAAISLTGNLQPAAEESQNLKKIERNDNPHQRIHEPQQCREQGEARIYRLENRVQRREQYDNAHTVK